MIKTLGIGALCAAALIGLPATQAAARAPLPPCPGMEVTMYEDVRYDAVQCDVRPPQILNVTMAPSGDIAARMIRCARMGGTLDLFTDELCHRVDY